MHMTMTLIRDRLVALIGVLIALGGVLPGLVAADDGEFPGRALHSQVKTIDTVRFTAGFAGYVVVDVRSTYEYETLHIKGAQHIPLYDKEFAAKAIEVQRAAGKTLVFYCNGRTCYKSYQAADKVRAAGLKDGVLAYDAGVFDWAKANPALTVLLGQSPIDPARLLGKQEFERHLLSPDDFADRVAAAEEPLVVDIRSRKQRRSVGLFMFKEQHIPLERSSDLDPVIAQAKQTGKPLLVYDMAGKQVRWLQYYLEAQGLTEYYFLRGGVRDFFKNSGS